MKHGTVLPDKFLRRMAVEDRPIGKAGMTTEQAQEKYEAGQEKILQRDAANLLRQWDVWFVAMPFGRKAPWIGWSDFFIIMPDGTPFFIEFKVGDNEASQEQLEFARKLPKGTIYRIARNLTELKSIIRGHREPNP